MTDEELTAQAAAAWETHNAGPRITGGPDYGRREFMAGYRAAVLALTDAQWADPAWRQENDRLVRERNARN